MLSPSQRRAVVPASWSRAASLLLVGSCLPRVDSRGADASKPHPHQGVLQKYERQPPSKYGISVSGVPLEALRSGKPVLKILSLPSGFKRAVSIQDIPAPPDVVWAKINDLDNYPSMVEGCAQCQTYRKKKSMGGKQHAWAKYRICAGPFAMEYFLEHTFEPAKSCMTFCLDYDRLSEMSDTVGYWCVYVIDVCMYVCMHVYVYKRHVLNSRRYVEKLEDGWSRVYYSADSQLPSWVRRAVEAERR